MKKIGITCDDYKANKYRKRFQKKGYQFEYDGPSGIPQVHLFRVEVEENDFAKEQRNVAKIIQELEIDLKRSN